VPVILTTPISTAGLITLVHVIVGTVTAILGLWIIAAWRFRQTLNYCLPKKRIMFATFIMWLTSLTFGIIFFFILNWTTLFS